MSGVNAPIVEPSLASYVASAESVSSETWDGSSLINVGLDVGISVPIMPKCSCVSPVAIRYFVPDQAANVVL